MGMDMRSFDSLKLAEGFMLETGSRAIGFFSSPESTEHSVYLTVAEQLSRSPSTAPKLARATIGRGTKGCTIYMIPSAPALTPSGSYVAPLLQHRFVLPASAADYRGLEMRHQSIPGSSAPGADGMTSGTWETMLEDEAMRLHRFLQAGALRSVSELTAAAMEGPAPLLDAAAVGLLLLPRGASASVRDYHLRRLRKLADSFPRWSCDSSEPPDPMSAVWLSKLPRCTVMPANATAHFAFVPTAGGGEAGGSAAGGAAPGAALNILLTALGAKLGLGPTALPQPGREAGFVLLTRGQSEATKAARPARSSPTWRVHVLPGAASAASVEAFCAQHLPWRRPSTASAQGREAAAHGEASRTEDAADADSDTDEEVIDFDEDGAHDEL